CGNLLAYLPGTFPEGTPEAELPPILLAAHMDTVIPGTGKTAVRKDGHICAGEGAVLGADDVSGIAEILEGIRILQEQDIPHRPAEILFTASEENYCRGSHAFDASKLQSEDAYIMDLAGPVGSAAVRAPSLIWFSVTVRGRAAHAGFCPEQGIHAVQAAAKAIARLPQGRLDEETTFNFGRIEGGRVSNIVPDCCTVIGEVRSYSHERALEVIEEMTAVFEEEAARIGASAEIDPKEAIHAYRIDENESVCRRFLAALETAGIPSADGEEVFVSTFGGSDNNVLSQRGIRGIVPTSGMYEPHSLQEYTTEEDLVQGARLIAALCMQTI
ncbi:MAG: M20/M25/M40 family metallo-hydrolase, partial [Firmicutes bacterium]|nr:M20/M25/M40 family metallo-hydrolase [Bacillota bacterium]